VDHILCGIIHDERPDRARCYASEAEYRKTVSAAEGTVRRVRRVIGGIVAYIVRTLLESSAPAPVLLPENKAGEPFHYYAMILICYVVQRYPRATWSWQPELDRQGTGNAKGHGAGGESWGWGILGGRLPSRQTSPITCSTQSAMIVKFKLLEWLHCQSITTLLDPTLPRRAIPPQWVVPPHDLQVLQYAAKTELARRIASPEPYRADDEIADRLCFLAEEMFPQLECTERLAQCIRKRVEEREYTRAIDVCRPGQVDDGPWEAHALCHHSRLVVAHKRMCATKMGSSEGEDAIVEVEHYRKKFYPFLTSEASLIPCWERNNSSARRGFLRSEATALLASTSLDMFQADFEKYDHHRAAAPSAAGDTRNGAAPSVAGRRTSVWITSGGSDAGGARQETASAMADTAGGSDAGGAHQETASLIADARGDETRRREYYASSKRHQRHTGEKANIEALLVQQLETLERLASARGLDSKIDYLMFRPPQTYHPEKFFSSLDDTPELYTKDAIAQTRDVPATIQHTLKAELPPKIGLRSQLYDKELCDVEKELRQNDDATTRLRELLLEPRTEIPEQRDYGFLHASWAAVVLWKLTVIDLTTPEPETTSKPEIICGPKIVKVVSDSVCCSFSRTYSSIST